MAKNKEEIKKLYAEGGEVLFKGHTSKKVWLWILALEEFLQGSPATAGLTDQQICLNVNSTLPRDQRISYSTFKKLTSGNYDRMDSWTQEQRNFMADMIEMARAVKSRELLELSVDPTNKNSIGSFRVVQAMNTHLQPQQQLGEGATILNITVGNPEQKELIAKILGQDTIDIAHEEVDTKKKLN